MSANYDEIKRHLVSGQFTVITSATFSNADLSLIETDFNGQTILFVKKPFSEREAWCVQHSIFVSVFVCVVVAAAVFVFELLQLWGQHDVPLQPRLLGQAKRSALCSWLLNLMFALFQLLLILRQKGAQDRTGWAKDRKCALCVFIQL